MLWPGGDFKAELLSALPPVHAPGAAGLQCPAGMLLGSNLSMAGSMGCTPWQVLPSIQPKTNVVPQDPPIPGKYYPWEHNNAVLSKQKSVHDTVTLPTFYTHPHFSSCIQE